MKRTIALILITVMLMTGVTVNAETSMGEKAMSMIKNQLEILRLQAKNVQSFVAIMEDLIPLVLSELKDIKKSDWFTENVALLYGMNIVQGDGAGFFLPNKEVTGSEYLKMVVVSLDNKTYKAAAGQQWDKPYIDRALELGLVKAGEIADYRKPLNRYNMAKIIVRACDESFSNYEMYQSSITDYSKIPSEYKECVLKAYSKGILTGYPDGTFGGANTMKRSESVAVIARLIEPGQRKVPKLPTNGTSSTKLNSAELQSLVEQVSGLVVPDKRNGDIILYSEDGNAGLYNSDIYINTGSDSSDPYMMNIESYTDKTLAKAKEILEQFYPTRHEEVYQAVMDAIKKDTILKETVKDNRTVYVFRSKDGDKVLVYIGKEGSR